jgi:hypothetical protein
MGTFQELQKAYGPDFEMINEEEEDRLEGLRMYVTWLFQLYRHC